MAGETQEASIGWGGAAKVHNGTTMYELVEVKSFTLPNDEFERVEKTHLKSPNKRRQYTSGLTDGSEITIVLNLRPLSDTDILIRDWKADQDSRAVELHIPEAGTIVAVSEFEGTCTGYDRGEVTADGLMEATVTVVVDTAEDFGAPD